MKRYEYRVEVITGGITGLFDDSKKQERQLNVPGTDGWELICISEGAKYMKYIYCREIDESAATAGADTTAKSKPAMSAVDRDKKARSLFAAAIILFLVTTIMQVSMTLTNFAGGVTPAIIAVFVIKGISLVLAITFYILQQKNEKFFQVSQAFSTVLILVSLFIGFIF